MNLIYAKYIFDQDKTLIKTDIPQRRNKKYTDKIEVSSKLRLQ